MSKQVNETNIKEANSFCLFENVINIIEKY